MLGASSKRQQTAAPARADALADVVLEDSSGAEVRLGDLWEDKPAVLVFLRHYG
jgi:prostamide/prostaglandin F2alpha synthase